MKVVVLLLIVVMVSVLVKSKDLEPVALDNDEEIAKRA